MFYVCLLGQSDRRLLKALYVATKGERWMSDSHWMSAAPLSKWKGVGVWNGTERVTHLNLNENNLRGVLLFSCCD